ncbi:MAG: BRO family protein, partial [Candidatus Fonsibacter sp.]
MDGNPWFNGKDIATLLGYVDTKQAVAKNENDDDRMNMEELMGVQETPLGIAIILRNMNISSQYCLTFGSKKREALLLNK